MGSVFWDVLRNFVQALIAVAAGNAIYFLALWPYLPPNARHSVYRIDLGLAVDFWICAACFGLIHLLWKKKKRR